LSVTASLEKGCKGLSLKEPAVALFMLDCDGRRDAEPVNNTGPVSDAKATLEAHIRQPAVELASAGITANAILAGVTNTNVLRQIPGYEKIMEVARERNPNRRLTQPEDVARCIAALCHPATYGLTGNTLHVDGGGNIG
jgi:enoyl-[acyl-carrier protein] reductase III